MIDYLAPCNGECTSVEKTSLRFTKIAEKGLVDGSTPPGRWASDELLAAGVSWDVKIPECVMPGNYVLRHEIIALHEAFDIDKAQNYPQCVNLKITGGGSEELAMGQSATAFYKPEDEGIMVGIYNQLTEYEIPGPGLWSCGGGGGEGSNSSSGSALKSGSSSGSGSGMGSGSNMGSEMGGRNGTETTKCRRGRTRGLKKRRA